MERTGWVGCALLYRAWKNYIRKSILEVYIKGQKSDIVFIVFASWESDRINLKKYQPIHLILDVII